MSVYDLVGEGDAAQQIKCTPEPGLHHYVVGAAIPLADGCYITHEGCFIVTDGIVAALARNLFTKWGDMLLCKDVLGPHDQVARAIAVFNKAAGPTP